jgi:D-arabinose 1-dehydrogenase-like Zn-dependent alcohol dehydrogenase
MLVKIAVASYCHTDHIVAAGWYNTPLPCTGSHEGVGTVVSVGPSVSGFKPGDRVLCGMVINACGKCDECTGPDTGIRQYCPEAKFKGVHTDGYFSEYVQVDARQSTPLPDAVSFLTASPLACAGRTMWRALLLSGLQPGETVALVGSGGGLGHLGIQFAKALGIRVIGIDKREAALKLSADVGADVVIDASKGTDEIVQEVKDFTGGRGADVTVNLIEDEGGPALCCAMTRLNGQVLQISQPPIVKVPYHEFVFRGIKMIGSLISSKEDTDSMVDLVVKHGITAKIKAFYGLDKIGELVDFVDSGNLLGKALIVLDQAQLDKEKALGSK